MTFDRGARTRTDQSIDSIPAGTRVAGRSAGLCTLGSRHGARILAATPGGVKRKSLINACFPERRADPVTAFRCPPRVASSWLSSSYFSRELTVRPPEAAID